MAKTINVPLKYKQWTSSYCYGYSDGFKRKKPQKQSYFQTMMAYHVYQAGYAVGLSAAPPISESEKTTDVSDLPLFQL